MTTLVLWSLLCGLCIIVELGSPGLFFFLSFALGALVAAGVSLMGLSSLVEVVVFLGVSVLSFFVLRWYAKHTGKENVQTNIYALKGKKGVVLAQITPLKRGWVKIEGETWAAAPVDNCSYDKGEIVQIVSVSGAHVKVRKSTVEKDECITNN